jgi:hypothetical protein
MFVLAAQWHRSQRSMSVFATPRVPARSLPRAGGVGGFGVAGARCAISEFGGRFDDVLWPAYVVTWRGTNKRRGQSEAAIVSDDVTT